MIPIIHKLFLRTKMREIFFNLFLEAKNHSDMKNHFKYFISKWLHSILIKLADNFDNFIQMSNYNVLIRIVQRKI